MRDIKYEVPEIEVGNQIFDTALGKFKPFLHHIEREFRKRQFFETRNEKRRFRELKRQKRAESRNKKTFLERARNHRRRIN